MSRPSISETDTPVADLPSPEVNPYAPTALVNESPEEGFSNQVRIRRKHINHETSIRAVGGLLCVLAVLFLAMLVMVVFAFGGVGRASTEELGVLAFSLLVGAVPFLAVGIGLRRLKPTARAFAIFGSLLGLLAFPFGTVLATYTLYLLISSKANTVFSSEYRTVIEQTPEVKCRSSIGGFITVLFFTISLIGFLVVGVQF